jgi:hypothetical protein
MTMRWIPFDPWWLVVAPIGSVVGGLAVLQSEGASLLFWLVLAVGIVAGTLAMERWIDRYHPDWFPGINAKR